MIGNIRPTVLEISMAAIPVGPERAIIGEPTAPNATAAVLAIRHREAAFKASKPRPTRIAAVMATGAPNPAAPSKNAEKEKAMSNTCKRLSSVMDTMEPLMRSNFPVFTVRL